MKSSTAKQLFFAPSLKDKENTLPNWKIISDKPMSRLKEVQPLLLQIMQRSFSESNYVMHYK